jgi:hypothetical protein
MLSSKSRIRLSSTAGFATTLHLHPVYLKKKLFLQIIPYFAHNNLKRELFFRILVVGDRRVEVPCQDAATKRAWYFMCDTDLSDGPIGGKYIDL